MDADSPSPHEDASTSDAPDFYVHKDGVNYGPETATNLRSLCAEGWLQAGDLVWREGLPEWRAADVVFASSFPAVISPPEAASFEPAREDDPFFAASAVHLPHEMSWPWGSFGLAVVGHALLLFLAVEWLQFHPIKFSSDVAPVTPEPPLEVTMVPEAPPAPPPPPNPTPPDPTPPPVVTAPTLPPLPMPDLTPPPPAPAEMPIPSLPPMPTAPPVVDNIPATPTPTPVPHPVHHKTIPHPAPVATSPPPEEAPPPAAEQTGDPQYLFNPRPEYPILARQRHQEGTVLLRVTLDGAGNPTSVEVEQSSGFGVLDQAARKKVAAQWKFKPGPGSTVHVPVEFHLDQL
jgi:protein TonB